jgi:hypothetical protein
LVQQRESETGGTIQVGTTKRIRNRRSLLYQLVLSRLFLILFVVPTCIEPPVSDSLCCTNLRHNTSWYNKENQKQAAQYKLVQQRESETGGTIQVGTTKRIRNRRHHTSWYNKENQKQAAQYKLVQQRESETGGTIQVGLCCTNLYCAACF